MTHNSSIHQFLFVENQNSTFDDQLLLPPIKIKAKKVVNMKVVSDAGNHYFV